MLGLQRDELHHGAEIVAEVQVAGGLHAGEHAGLLRCHASPLLQARGL